MRFNRFSPGLFFSLLFTGTLSAVLFACGSEQPSSGTGGGSTSTTSTTGVGGNGTTTTTTSTTTTTGAGGASVPCGTSLVCDPGQACIVDDFGEPCSAAPEDGGACPPGEHMSQCGGIGFACCCGEAPPSTFHCVSAPGCVAELTCECLGMVCSGDKWCQGTFGKPSEFHCSTPPMP